MRAQATHAAAAPVAPGDNLHRHDGRRNLPGWGRPDKIVRTREQRLWHESWTYDDVRFAARRLLRFVNGNLAAVDTEPIVEVSNGSLASLEVSN